MIEQASLLKELVRFRGANGDGDGSVFKRGQTSIKLVTGSIRFTSTFWLWEIPSMLFLLFRTLQVFQRSIIQRLRDQEIVEACILGAKSADEGSEFWREFSWWKPASWFTTTDDGC